MKTNKLGTQVLAGPLGTSLLLMPAAVLLVTLFVSPVIYAFYLGLTNLQLIGPHAIHYQFTGLANLKRLINDPEFWDSLWLTGVYIIGSSAFGCTVVALTLAMLMNSPKVPALGKRIVGTLAVLAWVIPPVTAALMWYAFSAGGGTFALLINSPDFNALQSNPMLVISLANIWATAGYGMLILWAGLKNIPEELYEAARVESVGEWKIFWAITMPLMKSTIVTEVLIVSLLSLSNFALIWVMTQGGPGQATNILPIYAYQQAFVFNNLSYGALIGVIMVIVSAALGFAYVKVSKERI